MSFLEAFEHLNWGKARSAFFPQPCNEIEGEVRSNLRTSPHLSHRSAIYHILMISHSGRTLLVNLPCKSSQNFMFCKLLYKKLCIINHETDAWCAKNEILTESVWNICIHCVSCKSVFRTYHYDQGRPSSQCHRAMALVVFCPAPNFRAYIECPVTKSLETPNWHWLISFPMGALVYDVYHITITIVPNCSEIPNIPT